MANIVAMPDERLAEITDEVTWIIGARHDGAPQWVRVGWAQELLIEIERLRAREAAVMEFIDFCAGQRPEWIAEDSILRRRLVSEARALLGMREPKVTVDANKG